MKHLKNRPKLDEWIKKKTNAELINKLSKDKVTQVIVMNDYMLMLKMDNKPQCHILLDDEHGTIRLFRGITFKQIDADNVQLTFNEDGHSADIIVVLTYDETKED